MKNLGLPLLGFVSMIAATALSPEMVRAAEADPVLTEKSSETFDYDLDGFTVSLPLEIKDRVKSVVSEADKAYLPIGYIDIVYTTSGTGAAAPRVIKGSVEVEAFKQTCNVQNHMGAVKQLILKQEKDRVKIRHLVKNQFDGYKIEWSQYFKGTFSGYNLELIDSKNNACYIFSLALEDFKGFSSTEIREALTPLVRGISKSMTNFAQ